MVYCLQTVDQYKRPKNYVQALSLSLYIGHHAYEQSCLSAIKPFIYFMFKLKLFKSQVLLLLCNECNSFLFF